MKGKINDLNKIKATLLIAVFILSTIAIAIPFASAAVPDVWVDDSFTGAETGYGTTKFDTIQAGYTAIDAGGTVHVAAGDYDLLSSFLQVNKIGITLQGNTANPETVTIDASGTPVGSSSIFIMASGVTFEGFTVKDSSCNGIGINYGTTGVKVQHNIISGQTTGCGVLLIYDGLVTTVVDGATVSDNVITMGTGASWCTGICLMESVKNSKITDNTIIGLSEGIVFKGGDTLRPTKDNIFTGNTITGSSSSGINIQVGLANGVHLTDNLIEGNTISEIGENGIKINTALTLVNFNITKNDIFENTEDGIEILSWETSGKSIIKHNNIWGNALFGISEAVSVAVNANLNWWGHPSEPNHHASSGDLALVTDVTHSTWLIGSYPDGLKNTGNVGDEGTVSGAKGTSTTPGGLLKFYWDEVHAWDAITGTGLLVTTYAKADQSFNIEITIPETVEDTHSILIYDDIDGALLTPVTFYQVVPEIALTPKAGIKGDTIDVTGTGFGDEEVITIGYPTLLDTIPVIVTTSDLGSFDASFVIPDAVTADITITATGVTSGVSDTADLSVGTVITLTPKKGLTGTTVTVVGRGFTALKTVDLRWYFGDPDETGTPYLTKVDDYPIDSTGGFMTSFTVPDVESGGYTVQAIDSKDPNPEKADAPYTVTGATKITLSPTSGIAGDPITVTGVWFTKGKTVIIYYDGTLLETTKAASTGTYGFAKIINIPDDATVGAHTIKAMDSEGVYDTATLTVVIEVTTIETGSDSYDAGDKISFNIHSTVEFDDHYAGAEISIVIKDPDSYVAWSVLWDLEKIPPSTIWVVTYQEQQTYDLTLPSDAKPGIWTWTAEYYLLATPGTKLTATGTFLVGEPVGPQPDLPAELSKQKTLDMTGATKTSFALGESLYIEVTVLNIGTEIQPTLVVVQLKDPYGTALPPSRTSTGHQELY